MSKKKRRSFEEDFYKMIERHSDNDVETLSKTMMLHLASMWMTVYQDEYSGAEEVVRELQRFCSTLNMELKVNTVRPSIN